MTSQINVELVEGILYTGNKKSKKRKTSMFLLSFFVAGTSSHKVALGFFKKINGH
jgi:hypothetical protein